MKFNNLLLCMICLIILSSCATTDNKKKRNYSNRSEHDIQALPGSPEMLNVELGVGYLKRGHEGDIDIALQKFKKAIGFNPKYALAHSLLANAYDKKGLFNNAKTHYELSMKYNIGLPDIINNYANFLCQRGQYDLAVANYLKVVANPQYKTPAFAYENAGVCSYKSQNFIKAEEYFRKSLLLNKQLSNSLYYLMLIHLDNQQHMKARAFLQRLEELVQPSSEILVAGYKIEKALGNNTIAKTYLQKLQTLYPGSEALRRIN